MALPKLAPVEHTAEAFPGAPRRTTRLRGLDVTRGLVIVGMILVNDQGDPNHPFPQLAHSAWNGLTVADLVFPAFVFMLGVSAAFSLAHYEAGHGTWRLHRRILRRALTLVAVGFAMNALPHPYWAELRYPGVLQRLGVCYLLLALAVVHLRARAQLLVGAATLLTGWALIAILPVPGVGHPAMTPDASVFGWIDQHVFGLRHVYGNGGYDPEGLLGTAMATVGALAGYRTGLLLRTIRSAPRQAFRLGAIGFGVTLIGFLWGTVLPINKRIGTPSFVVVTSGLTLLLLTSIVAALDLRSAHWPAWRIPEAMGRNALLLYVGSDVLAHQLTSWKAPWDRSSTLRRWANDRLFHPWAGDPWSSFAYGLALVGGWALVALYLDRRRWYLTA